MLKSYHKIAHYICFLVKNYLKIFFSCGVIANFVFFVTKMLIPQGVMRCQHSLTPELFEAGIHPGIFTLSRVEFAIVVDAVVLKRGDIILTRP